jgi:YD repeat-containing protein
MLGLVWLLLGIAAPRALAVSVVNTDTGNYAYTFTDIALQDDPFFTFVRAYNSLDARSGPLGPGWTHNFNVRLVQDTTSDRETLAFIGPDGHTERYLRRADGGFQLASMRGGTLIQHQDGPFVGAWELGEPDGMHYELRADGRPTRISYDGAPGVPLTYDERGRLQSAATATGERQMSFAYDDGDRLASINDRLNPPRQIRFGYDELGRLATVADRLGYVTRYSYDGTSQRLHELVDPRGHVALRQEYDPDGRVVKQWTARGVASGWPTTFAYGRDAGADDVPPEGYSTTVTYPPGGLAPSEPTTTVLTYDGLGRLVRRETSAVPGDDP